MISSSLILSGIGTSLFDHLSYIHMHTESYTHAYTYKQEQGTLGNLWFTVSDVHRDNEVLYNDFLQTVKKACENHREPVVVRTGWFGY